MNFITSTPLIIPKPSEHALRRRSNEYKSVAQQLFQNNNSCKNTAITENNELKDGNLQFVNLPNGPTQDLFFAQNLESESSTRHTLPSVIVTEDDDIVRSLRKCTITKDSSANDSTLKAIDQTSERFSIANKVPTPVNKCNVSQGRRQSHITTASPFSFELREIERRERKTERMLFQKHIEKQNTHVFKAKPAPSFKAQPKAYSPAKLTLTNKDRKTPESLPMSQSSAAVKKIRQEEKCSSKTTKVTLNKKDFPIAAIPPFKPEQTAQVIVKQLPLPEQKPHESKVEILHVNDVMQVDVSQQSLPLTVSKSKFHDVITESVKQSKICVPQTAEIINLDMQVPLAVSTNNFQVQVQVHDTKNHGQVEEADFVAKENTIATLIAQKQFGKKDENTKSKKIESWKKKPFQVNLPHRRLTIPVSPQLMTAQRARNREAFDERVKEKEKEREMILKRNNPLKTFLPKRGAAEPLMSKYMKRARHQI